MKILKCGLRGVLVSASILLMACGGGGGSPTPMSQSSTSSSSIIIASSSATTSSEAIVSSASSILKSESSSSSSEMASSSSVPGFVATSLSQVDVEKQTHPTKKLIRYMEAIELIANKTLDFRSWIYDEEIDKNLGLSKPCDSGSFSLEKLPDEENQYPYYVYFRNCFYEEYGITLHGAASLNYKPSGENGFDEQIEILSQFLEFTYNNIDPVLENYQMWGKFEVVYSTTETTSTKQITSIDTIKLFQDPLFLEKLIAEVNDLDIAFNANYAKGTYTVDINAVLNDIDLGHPLHIFTDEPFNGKNILAPHSGSLVQRGYGNNLKFRFALDPTDIKYEVSVDLGNSGSYEMVDTQFLWDDISNRALFIDITTASRLRNSSDVRKLNLFPNQYSYPKIFSSARYFEGAYVLGHPGDNAYEKKTSSAKGVNVFLWYDMPDSILDNFPIHSRGADGEYYIFDLRIVGTHTLTIMPRSGTPSGRYSIDVILLPDVDDDADYHSFHVSFIADHEGEDH